MRIKDIINKILWKYSNLLDEYLLVVVDRVSQSGFRYIEFKNIKHVNKNYIYIADSNNTVAIPIHRVIMIEKKNGEIIWRRKRD